MRKLHLIELPSPPDPRQSRSLSISSADRELGVPLVSNRAYGLGVGDW